ncbi:MAG: pilus (MSHA type) biogenesis protein MshL [Thermodesulfovibrionales bacterium]|nr:pilus (MSHA type) biogenesis protein MshL [Thermodesulfovibrionales bacterium]
MKKLLIFILVCCFLSCAHKEIKSSLETIEPPAVEHESRPVKELPPEPLPVNEELSPLKEIKIDLKLRNSPLRDVLHIIADAGGLNLVIENGVNSETPLTITLKGVTLYEALEAVFDGLDYFWEIKNNILRIIPQRTKVFELPLPPLSQSIDVNLGGDILGGIQTAEGLTTGNIRGEISQKIASDRGAYDFWKSIEESIKKILDMSVAPLKPSFTLNKVTGTVFVTAGKRDLGQVERFLNRLKESLSRQVMIEARIAEVQLNDTLRYGIDWTFLDNWRGVGDISVGTTGFKDVVDIPRFSIGITGANFNSILRALETQGRVNVLSNPKINIMNGQTALLSVGRNFSFISRVETTTTTTGTAPTITFTVTTSSLLSGIMLGVIPFVDDRGEISMTITPIISDLVSMEERTIGQPGQNIVQISLPTVDLREMSTIIKVKNGETIIIGGLIQDKDSVRENRVPLLGSLPLIGTLFKSHEKIKDRKELVIMLRPVAATETYPRDEKTPR